MKNIALNTNSLKEALKSYDKPVSFNLDDTSKTTSIFLNDANKDLLEWLRDHFPLTNSQQIKIEQLLNPTPISLEKVESSSVEDLFRKVGHVFKSAKTPVLECKIAGKWYPMMCGIEKISLFSGQSLMTLSLYANIGTGSLQYNKNYYIGPWDFESVYGDLEKKSFLDLLDKIGLRLATEQSIKDANKANDKVQQIVSKNGTTIDVVGSGLTYHSYWGWEELTIGYASNPTTSVLESKLEDAYAQEYYDESTAKWTLPFIRIFSLKYKQYMYVDADYVKEHVFHPENKEKIILPPQMKTVLDSVFNSKQEDIFGDIFHGRHGGIVILANGSSGVGKTLCAEVFADSQGRPLYPIEMSEIGTNVQTVEKQLQIIFSRAKKWNAVLLFDEADIFLSERESSDLERSAIVGIFLRLLDYYEGTFFLTTNRGEHIDKAFKSRVTLYLNFPELSPEIRIAIWKSMLEAAHLQVEENSEHTWEQIGQKTLNGRQIRNQVRLLKLLSPTPGTVISTTDIMNSLQFAAL